MKTEKPIIVWLSFLWMALEPQFGFAQDSELSRSSVNSDTGDARTVLDEELLVLPRAGGMGGGLSAFAQGLDAAIYNPAGIGGFETAKEQKSSVHRLYFPHISFESNPQSKALQETLTAISKERPPNPLMQASSSEDELSKKHELSLGDAAAGERQFARVSMVPVAVEFGRSIFLPFYDEQIAAVPVGDGQIDMHRRNVTGVGGGFAASDPEERLQIGYFGYFANRLETKGRFATRDIGDRQTRGRVFSENTESYQGVSHNLGAKLRLGKTWAPTLAITLKDLGSTTWRSAQGLPAKTTPQDLNLGVGFQPQLKWFSFRLMLEAARLLEQESSLLEKYRAGFEAAFPAGDRSFFALRAGYTHEGGSAGLSLNLGLLGAEVAVHRVDIGAGNEKVIEQRYQGSFFINVAEF